MKSFSQRLKEKGISPEEFSAVMLDVASSEAGAKMFKLLTKALPPFNPTASESHAEASFNEGQRNVVVELCVHAKVFG